MTLKKAFSKNWKGYLFLLPVFIFMGTFKYIPLFQAVFMSFYEWNGVNIKNFIGLQNYMTLWSDHHFHVSLKNMAILTVGNVLIQMIFPLIAATLVYHVANKRVQNFFKLWFVIPLVIPAIVTFLLWQWMYAADYGVINEFLKWIGLESWTRSWLGDTNTALMAVLFVNFPWVGGIPFLLFLAGLMSISKEMFEVARIDGMNVLQRFWNIELPLIRSQIKIVVLLTIIAQVQNFENIMILTAGGPGTSTLIPAYYLYVKGFTYYEMGYASAIGVVLFIIMLALSVMNHRFVKNSEKLD